MATPTFITKEEVRRICGITSTEVSDDDVDDLAAERENIIEKYLNTAFTPKKEIDRLNGTNRNMIFTRKGPLLAIREMKIQTTDITISNLNFQRSGKITLNANAEQVVFLNFPQLRDAILINYVYGMVSFPERGGTETTTDVASTVGTSVALSVVSGTSFTVGDWVRIYGMDGNDESAQVSAKDTTEITVDNLRYTHSSGSFVRKLDIQEKVKQLIRLETCLALIARETGQSFDDIVGYTIGERQVQKGEPFTQWREAWRQILAEWKELKKRVRPFPTVSVKAR